MGLKISDVLTGLDIQEGFFPYMSDALATIAGGYGSLSLSLSMQPLLMAKLDFLIA